MELGPFDIDTPEGMALAKEWTERLIDTINDGGVWFIPRSSTVITLDKSHKVATVGIAIEPDPSIVRVLEAMGWTVVNRDWLTGNPNWRHTN